MWSTGHLNKILPPMKKNLNFWLLKNALRVWRRIGIYGEIFGTVFFRSNKFLKSKVPINVMAYAFDVDDDDMLVHEECYALKSVVKRYLG